MAEAAIRVLILDDDPDDVFLIEDHFDDLITPQYDLSSAGTMEEALELVGEQGCDVVLCDYRLGAISGLEAIERFRAAQINVPIILLTGVGTRDLDAKALDAGAADFLAKDELSPALIDRTIRYAIAAHERQSLLQAVLDAAGSAVMLLEDDGRVSLSNAVAENLTQHSDAESAPEVSDVADIARLAIESGSDEVRLNGRVLDRSTTLFGSSQRLIVLQDVTDRANILEERRRSEERLAQVARHDALTGLGNRLALTEVLDEWLVRGKQDGERFAILTFDLDRFKEINDVHGHAVGDDLLRSVARRLQNAIGERVFLARLGGDEFIALVKLTSPGVEDASDLAGAMLRLLMQPNELDGKSIECSASIGISCFPDHGTESEILVANADLAMYRAKKTPTHHFCVFNKDMDAAIRADRALAEELRTAIDNDMLDIFVQPQATLDDRRLTGFETLARWTRRKGGPIPPDRFVRVAEETGLILPLGEHLLKLSLQEAAKWKNRAKVAINVSPVQINHCDLPAILRDALIEHRMSPSRIEVEITETSLLENTERALHSLRQIRSMGISVALDDFGTGFSSLSMLQSFPFDKIKIDRSFVMELDRHGNEAIVRSIALLGESLGIRVLCEGVETEAHARTLAQLGCGEMQGYLLSRPIPANEADHWATGFAAANRVAA